MNRALIHKSSRPLGGHHPKPAPSLLASANRPLVNTRDHPMPSVYVSGHAAAIVGRRVFLAGTDEIVHLGILFLIIGGVYEFLPETDYALLVPVFSLLLAGIMGLACYRQITMLPAMLWSSLVWFRLGVAIFVGFGTAVPTFLDSTSLVYIHKIYPFTDREAMKFIAMSILSCIVVMCVARLFSIRVPPPSESRDRVAARIMFIVAVAFLIVGGLTRYGVLLPKWLGQTDGAVVGWLSSFAKIYAAGLFLLMLWTLQNARSLVFIPLTLVAIDAMVGILAWDKSELVFTLTFAYLAIIYSKFSAKRAAIGLIAIISVIYFTQPLVHYGRSQIALGEAGSLGQRLSVLSNYFDSNTSEAVSASVDRNPLIRFSYVGPATFFMKRYDNGFPGNAHEHALAALIPRAVWPNKPNVGESGLQAYSLLRGTPDSKTAVGITQFAEAYWSFGWLGAFLVFIPGGVILAAISVRGVQLILDERWFQLPVVLLSLNIGYKVSGSWVPTVVGGIAIYAAISIIFTLAERALLPGSKTKSRTPTWQRAPYTES